MTEHCDLCSAALGKDHEHVVAMKDGRLMCSCQACCLLFAGQGTTYRRVPRHVKRLADIPLSDDTWGRLSLPVDLVFFAKHGTSRKLHAVHPSPAGPVASSLAASAEAELSAAMPALAALEPEVQGLLVNRLKGQRAYYVAPIDRCFKLVGLLRLHWRGFTGGEAAWGAVDSFFRELDYEA